MTKIKKFTHSDMACYQMYNNLDEVFGSLNVLRHYLETAQPISSHVAKNALNGIFTQLIHAQSNMMDEANLEY
jgi:hypothetical protein